MQKFQLDKGVSDCMDCHQQTSGATHVHRFQIPFPTSPAPHPGTGELYNLGASLQNLPTILVHRFQLPKGLSLPNLDGLKAPDEETRKRIASDNVLQLNATQVDPSLTWEFVAWARQHWQGPIFVKARPALMLG